MPSGPAAAHSGRSQLYAAIKINNNLGNRRADVNLGAGRTVPADRADRPMISLFTRQMAAFSGHHPLDFYGPVFQTDAARRVPSLPIASSLASSAGTRPRSIGDGGPFIPRPVSPLAASGAVTLPDWTPPSAVRCRPNGVAGGGPTLRHRRHRPDGDCDAPRDASSGQRLQRLTGPEHGRPDQQPRTTRDAAARVRFHFTLNSYLNGRPRGNISLAARV